MDAPLRCCVCLLPIGASQDSKSLHKTGCTANGCACHFPVHASCNPDAYPTMIYFPNHGKPAHTIRVCGSWEREWEGSPNRDEILRGRHAYYSMSRCIQYSTAIWDRIQRLLEERAGIDKQLERIMKGKGV